MAHPFIAYTSRKLPNPCASIVGLHFDIEFLSSAIHRNWYVYIRPTVSIENFTTSIKTTKMMHGRAILIFNRYSHFYLNRYSFNLKEKETPRKPYKFISILTSRFPTEKTSLPDFFLFFKGKYPSWRDYHFTNLESYNGTQFRQL